MRMSLNLDPAFLLSSRAYGLKRENVIWVKRIVAGVWSKGENSHFGSKERFIRITGYKMRMY